MAETLKLVSGDKFPTVGLGFWKTPKPQVADLVVQALQGGYRHLDSACDYGNEVEIGQGLQTAFDKSLCRREELWVTSKLWNTYHRKEHVRPALERTLADLGLDYLDLYLIHFPISQKFVPFDVRYPPEWFYDPSASSPRIEEDPVPILETWHAMEELHREGLVKNIGICNFGTSLIRDLLSSCSIRPAVLQVELHPYLSQEKLVRYCQQEQIAVTGFSPLGAQSYIELGVEKSQAVLNDPAILAIAKAHQKSAAQITLRWAVQRGTAVVPKTSQPSRLKENLELFDFELSASEMTEIGQLDRGQRFNDPGDFTEAAFNTFFPIYE
jgi:D-xylose reductase